MLDADSRYSRCKALILHWEGKYTNNPKDKGGPTNMGITQRALSEWLGRPATINDVKNLTVDVAGMIYRHKYWTYVGDELPAGVDLMYFNAAVNCGRGRAAKFLQQAAGVKVDGVVGPVTLAAVSHAAPDKIVNEFTRIQEAYYRGLDDFDTFGKGWLNRLKECMATAHSWVAA